MRVSCWWLALLFALPGTMAAQQLEIRQMSPFDLWNLSDSLGVIPDSMHKVGRGVWIRDLKVGTGEPAATGDRVAVHYIGRLADGSTFDNTRGTPYTFVLGAAAVIDGWEDGVPGMRVGGHRQLVIPPWLGYGARPNGPIPGDAVLIFEIVLAEIKDW